MSRPIIGNSLPWSKHLPSYLGKLSFDLSNQRGEPVCEKDLSQPLLGIVSSHDKKLGFADSNWQQALNCALTLAKRQSWTILFADETPYAAAVEHHCATIGLAFLKLKCDAFDSRDELPSELQKIPHRDRAVAFLSTRVFALRVRPSSKTAALLDARLAMPDTLPASVYVAFSIDASDQTIVHELMGNGAVGWMVTFGKTQSTVETCNRSHLTWTQQISIPKRYIERFGDRYFVHCTRARRGPWPDQSLSQFHDELFRNPWSKQPESLATLIRILQQQRLIATTHLRRSSIATLCFTAQPWKSLEKMRTYQSHLGRWDWEPYGIMIDREWLQERGAKPVQYIGKEQAKCMSDQELAFAQVCDFQSNSYDWSHEQEWRLVGDLRLNQLPFSKGLIFVPSHTDEKTVAHLSRWPVACVSE